MASIVSDTKFLLDENIPELFRRFLESRGYPTEYAAKGTKNGKLASLALEKECVLVSRDRDFLNSVSFPPSQFSGIVVFTVHPPKAEKLIKGMEMLLSEVKEFKGKLFVVEEEGFEAVE